ncbi:MAG: phosphoglucosamine mutase [Bifidobacteriaceae bacterium]|jgi:phosphoglucosamine mutase|nr:phosphoglucosamine mutase [Bifidobacteriaceae bacterium]
MPRLFGTDGVRGLANEFLVPDLALKLGRAAGRILVTKKNASGNFQTKNSKYRAVVGRDTRISGEFLSASLCAGLASTGIDVIDVGIIPTPAVAYLSQNLGVELGAVISASHNPMQDNGIKFFGSDGFKLPDEIENRIEDILDDDFQAPLGGRVGHISYDFHNASNNYVNYLVDCIAQEDNREPLKGIKVVVDPANGAASWTAPEAMRKLGADVIVINDSPDGVNINLNCGSTHPEQLQSMTVAAQADLGIAFDGDADRIIAVDEKGAIVNGDKIMGVIAQNLQKAGKLKKNTIVATVMSNLGFLQTMKKQGIKVLQTAVGDRYVTQTMRQGGFTFGGEQSGHIINSNFSTTGDGTLSGLMLMKIFAKSSYPLSNLVENILSYPQVLLNVENVDKTKIESNNNIKLAVSQAERKLGNQGRILLRPSGTEPVVRVMVEAKSQDQALEIAENLAKIVVEFVGL